MVKYVEVVGIVRVSVLKTVAVVSEVTDSIDVAVVVSESTNVAVVSEVTESVVREVIVAIDV